MPIDPGFNADNLEELFTRHRLEEAQGHDITIVIADNGEWLPRSIIERTPLSEFYLLELGRPERSARDIKTFLDPADIPFPDET